MKDNKHYPMITPIGKVLVEVDKKEKVYDIREYSCFYNGEEVKGYEIIVELNNANYISCVINYDDDEILVGDEPGEFLLCKSFEKNNLYLSIGGVDYSELYQSNINNYVLGNGLGYYLDTNIESITFKIAYVTDYKGIDDLRTWFAIH